MRSVWDRHRRASRLRFLLTAASCLLLLVSWPHVEIATGAETVFLQDGRTIRADEVEIVGDIVRLRMPAETVELHRSEILSIHRSSTPAVSPGPADVYRDTTRQMNEKVRREIEGQPGRQGAR